MASNDTPRAARKARPQTSLKMQAIGFLSRREHSRQELRAKLLGALRKRAREEAELAQAVERQARERAQALLTAPSNGIDDAFMPPLPPLPAAAARPNGRTSLAERPGRSPLAGQARLATAPISGSNMARVAPIVDSVRRASGDALSGPLRASLAAAAATMRAGSSLEGGVDVRSGHLPHGAIASASRPSAADGAADAESDAEFFIDAKTETETETETEREREPEAVVDELLDWLVANQYLSEERFVESRVNARARKQGTMLIKQELSRHGLTLEPQQAAALRETEFARAKALWERKFGEVGIDARARAKQARFLASRGFAADVVRRIVGGNDEF